jgi:ribosomal protein L11 methylase PrmA
MTADSTVQNVIDVGTGTGIWAMYVALSPIFLKLAHRKALIASE